jgi:Domain of unknown function (DUF5104)
MKKTVLVFLMILLALLVPACKPGYINQSTESHDQAVEILRCLDEEDAEGLKNMFCERIATTHDLEEEINSAFEFYQGKSTTFPDLSVGGGYWTVDGEYVDNHLEYSMRDIITGEDEQYDIYTHSYLIYKDDPTCVGITYLKIINTETDERIIIGEYVQ